MFSDLIDYSRYILPILAVFILGFCLCALLRRRPQSLGPVQLINTANGDFFPITARETSIGRHKNCDIVLDYPTVSRQHGVLTCGKDGWYIKSVSNSVPIKVNGAVIEKKQLIATGSKITFGEVTLLFENRVINRQEINNGKKEK